VIDWRLGLAVVVILVLVPTVYLAVFAVRLIVHLVKDSRESREAEARRVNVFCPASGSLLQLTAANGITAGRGITSRGTQTSTVG